MHNDETFIELDHLDGEKRAKKNEAKKKTENHAKEKKTHLNHQKCYNYYILK